MPSTRDMPSTEEVLQRFRTAGVKATPQRLAVYRALAGRFDHPSPEALYRAVRAQIPAISLATVYKALDALEAKGLVTEVSRLLETKRYDANLTAHHHLVCTRCKRIFDLALPGGVSITPPGGFGPFVPTETHVQILGVCGDCRDQKEG